ncbi:MAG: hypothetical protein ACK2UQ_12665 [Anaerolineae bacterium]
MTVLHEKYAPILRFNKNEQFYPMRINDMLRYSALYVKDQDAPIVPTGQVAPSDLTGRSPEVFLRSVETGPLFGKDALARGARQAIGPLGRDRQPEPIVERATVLAAKKLVGLWHWRSARS